ncbi:hypothetical protein RHGRI_011630 [Rhododendron griersonianum]|uniref:THO1-MOS11 C-terminal domain-containing protein n=1 Tax=Rhododendron griersonianum TaxID=479676 RepID=A0AAV6KMZ3_9ERIC|nr:hypothetical protein RHGRI_011630 [Rhododendron griersonianum]
MIDLIQTQQLLRGILDSSRGGKIRISCTNDPSKDNHPLDFFYGFRFGTISTIQGSNTLKQSEEHKRKARAERFGLAQSVTADEEAKKKARLSRFGAVPAVPKANAQEEDKKKARALSDDHIKKARKAETGPRFFVSKVRVNAVLTRKLYDI